MGEQLQHHDRKIGLVALVGAGPGDPGLMTLRGKQLIEAADVLLYDALAHPQLLALAPAGTEQCFVGKRGGSHENQQCSINALLVSRALSGQRVVRLKGGDPYLFGRGSEEAEILSACGIPFEVVPGVPSPVAATAYAGISLTHRRLSSSVAYVTATEAPGKTRSAHDWSRLATATDCLVVFMGLRRLGELCELLIAHGRPEGTPAAVIQDASLPTQRTVVGTLDTLAARASAARMRAPALIVVGEVVGLRQRLRWFDMHPLFGKRILSTRPEQQSRALRSDLARVGAEVICAPTIETHAIVPNPALEAALGRLTQVNLLLFTSANAVDAFMASLKAHGLDARALAHITLACVGPKTARALTRFGLCADVTPPSFSGAELASYLGESGQLSGSKVLFPRAKVADEATVVALKNGGATVDVVPVYETTLPGDTAKATLVSALTTGVDATVFTSASTAKNFSQLCATLGLDAERGGIRFAIGPSTAKALASSGLPAHHIAPEATHEGLVSALLSHFADAAPCT